MVKGFAARDRRRLFAGQPKVYCADARLPSNDFDPSPPPSAGLAEALDEVRRPVGQPVDFADVNGDEHSRPVHF